MRLLYRSSRIVHPHIFMLLEWLVCSLEAENVVLPLLYTFDTSTVRIPRLDRPRHHWSSLPQGLAQPRLGKILVLAVRF